MKTRQDLIERALELLNVIAAGQTPEPEDVQVIDASMDGVLLETGINVGDYYDADRGIRDEYISALAVILANENAPAFGQPQNADSKTTAILRLRYMRPSTYVGQPIEVDYF